MSFSLRVLGRLRPELTYVHLCGVASAQKAHNPLDLKRLCPSPPEAFSCTAEGDDDVAPQHTAKERFIRADN